MSGDPPRYPTLPGHDYSEMLKRVRDMADYLAAQPRGEPALWEPWLCTACGMILPAIPGRLPPVRCFNPQCRGADFGRLAVTWPAGAIVAFSLIVSKAIREMMEMVARVGPSAGVTPRQAPLSAELNNLMLDAERQLHTGRRPLPPIRGLML